MYTHPTQAPQQHDPGQQAPDTQAYCQVLHDLIAMGTDLARQLHQQATAQPPKPAAPPLAPAPETLINLTTAFDRTARAVRRSIMLSRGLAEPPHPAPDPTRHRTASRKRILREVEDVIQRTPYDGDPPDPDGTDADSLNAELHDRLDAPDLEDDIGTRPIPEIITEICRDLGLAALPGSHPWKRRTPDDIQQLCARAAAASPAPHPRPAQDPSRTTRPGPQHPEPPPINPGAIPRTHPFTRAGNNLPDDPAEAIAMVLRHGASVRAPRHPPPFA